MANVKLWTKQHAPEILLVSGITNSAAAIILASVATKKLPKVITPVKKEIIKIHAKMDNTEKDSDEVKKLKAELNKLYLKTGLKIVGMYAPAALTFGLSTASMIGSHNIMRGRNAALAAALVTLKGGYDAYRERVKEKIGEKAEEAIYQGLSEKKITELDENGNEVTKTVSTVDNKREDIDYGIFWGPGNEHYVGNTITDIDENGKVIIKTLSNGDFNFTTLCQIQDYMNQKCQAQGYLKLSDVYKALGVRPGMLSERKLQAAEILGWIFDGNKKYDNYISFGIQKRVIDKNGNICYGEYTNAAKRFQQGYDEFIWLDFNVDGDIITGSDNGRTFMNIARMKG